VLVGTANREKGDGQSRNLDDHLERPTRNIEGKEGYLFYPLGKYA